MNSIDKSLISNKTSCYIFDIDGCLADSNSIIITKEESYKKALEEYDALMRQYERQYAEYKEAINLPCNKSVKEHIPVPVEPIKPTEPDSKTKKDFDDEYFYNHIQEVSAISGILDLFVNLALNKKVILLTARKEESKQATLNWLNKVITKRYNSNMYRRIDFVSIFKSEKCKDVDEKYKRNKVLELAKQYNVELIIDDSPRNIKEFTELGFLTLQPNILYKDLK